MGKYDDIIHLPHHVSMKHSRMSAMSRAAQFAPFAALSGYDDAIDETARLTDAQIALGEGAIQELNEKLRCLTAHLADSSNVTILYFIPDAKKAGGRYTSVTGKIKKIKAYEQEIEMADGTIIAFSRMLSIDSDLLRRFEMPEQGDP